MQHVAAVCFLTYCFTEEMLPQYAYSTTTSRTYNTLLVGGLLCFHSSPPAQCSQTLHTLQPLSAACFLRLGLVKGRCAQGYRDGQGGLPALCALQLALTQDWLVGATFARGVYLCQP